MVDCGSFSSVCSRFHTCGSATEIARSRLHQGNLDQNAEHLSYIHTHPFNGPFSSTTRVSRYQKGKTNLDFTEARDSEWQWHQLGHMQVCTSLQTDDHASNPPLSFFTGRMPFLPPNQQCQGTEGITSIIHVVPKMGRTSRELTNKWKLHSHVSRLHELLRGKCLNFRGTNSAPPDELATLTTEVH